MNKQNFANYSLITLNIISIIFIIQIDFGVLPLINSQIHAEKIQRINNLISNISQGVLVSTFFYLLLVYFPERSRAITTRKLIQPRLDTIVIMMQNSIAYFVYKHNLKSATKDFSDLTFEDFKNIERIEDIPMNFKYKLKFKQNDYWTQFSSGTVTEIDNLEHERKILRNKIDKILSLPIISNEEDLLIETLSKLRDSWFYSGVDSYFKKGKTTTVQNFNKGLYEYYLFFLTLSKFSNKPKIEILKK